jgi:hypothetical protein
MQVTTEKYNPLRALETPSGPPLPSLYESLVMSFRAIYKIYIDPVATGGSIEFLSGSYEMR